MLVDYINKWILIEFDVTTIKLQSSLKDTWHKISNTCFSIHFITIKLNCPPSYHYDNLEHSGYRNKKSEQNWKIL